MQSLGGQGPPEPAQFLTQLQPGEMFIAVNQYVRDLRERLKSRSPQGGGSSSLTARTIAFVGGLDLQSGGLRLKALVFMAF